jgi:hypothetical protein
MAKKVAQKKTAIKKVAKPKATPPAPVEEEVVEVIAEEVAEQPQEANETALAPTSPAAVAQMPLGGGGKLGLEEVDQDDLIIPYAKLMQPLSPEVDEGIAIAGEIVNSVTKFDYGQGVLFIPLVLNKRRIFWPERDSGETGVRCASSNFKQPDQGAKYHGSCARCQYSQWGEESTPPECSAILTFPSLIIGVIGDDGEYYELPDGAEGNEMVAISFLKTGYKAGKQLTSMATFGSGNLFENIYELTTQKEKNDKGTFHVFKVQPSGSIEDDIREKVMGLYKMLASAKWQTNFDEGRDENFGPADDQEGPFE